MRVAPSADGVGVDDLTLAVLEQVAEAAVENPRGALRQRRRVPGSFHALAACLHPN